MPDASPDTTASDEMVRTLEEIGIDTVFALPGEENLPVVSALKSSRLTVVVCRHEQHAGFMAVAHARLTGRPAVTLATLGPGALNTFTPVAQALLLHIPMVVLTGQKALRDNEEGSFQVVDVVGSARPLTKHAVTVSDPAEISAVVIDAVSRAMTAPAGPVLVEIPEDVAAAPIPRVTTSATAAVSHAGRSSATTMNELTETIRSTPRPLVLAGSGCANNEVSKALRRLCERENLPVLATQMGKGVVDESGPHSLRSLGIHRSDHSHRALAEASLIITVGYHPTEHPPRAWNLYGQEVIHVSDHPAPIEVGYRPSLQAVGRIDAILDDLPNLAVTPWHAEVRSQIIAGLEVERHAARTRRDAVSDPLSVVEALEQLLVDLPNLSISLDNGAYKVWLARHLSCPSFDSLYLDNALATMGAGLATGTEAARLGRRSIVVTGDGGLMMNLGDLETACRLGVDMTVLVVRDDRYGFIAWHQDEQDRDRSFVDVSNPDLVVAAEAFGAQGIRVSGPEQLSEILSDAVDQPGVTVVDCPIDYGINDMLDPDELPSFTAGR